MDELLKRFHVSPGSLGLFLALFVGTLLASLAVAAFILVRVPPDEFEEKKRPPGPLWKRVIKNVLGFALIVLGIGLSVPGVPGQGLLTILVGAMLIDSPVKRPIERAILGRPSVMRAINALRARFGREPLRPPKATKKSVPENP